VELCFTMEATGVYYENLAWHLHQQDRQVSVVLANLAKKYLQSLGYKSKNDKIDAKGLAQMGRKESCQRGNH
jgi:transposase